MHPSEPAFCTFLEKNPHLCASGLASPDLCRRLQLDYASERQRLKNSYGEFSLCFDWLLDCTPMRRVSCVAPAGSDLRKRIELAIGSPLPLGALIAAVLYLRLPHHHPADSPDVRVGISVRSPPLNETPA
jgi:hypothetical protein